MKRYAPLVMICLFFSNGVADTGNESISDRFSWIHGCWEGSGLGGQITECWLPSGENRFTGVFQLMSEGELQFTEIFMLDVFDGNLGLRVKHFDVSFTQWKSDKQTGATFPLASSGENHVQFEGLRYELIDNNCHITLDMQSGDEVKTVTFVLKRMSDR